MQSYYVDEWQAQGILLEATFTPLSFGAQWLPGVGEAFADRVAQLRPHRLDRRPPARPLRGPRRARRAAVDLRLSYKLSDEEARAIQFGIARAAEIHFAAGADGGLSQRRRTAPVIPRGRLADFEAMELKPADLRLEAFHPMSTARMGADPAESVDGPRRRRTRHRGPLRRRREPAAHLGRRQPDDDHHRDGLTGRAGHARSDRRRAAARRRPSAPPASPGSRRRTIPALASRPRNRPDLAVGLAARAG